MIATHSVIIRIGIGGYLNVVWFNKNDTIEQRIDKFVLSTVLTEGIFRYSVWRINKLPIPTPPPKFLGKTRAVARTVGKIGGKAGAWSLGIGLGAVALNVGARGAESVGLIAESSEDLAVDFSHQALFVASLGTTGVNPLSRKDEWLNVAKLLISPISDRYDPVLGWSLPGVRDQGRRSLMPYV